MSKYEPLARFLATSGKVSIALSFAQIEDILGFRLPRSARLYPAWWSNNEGSHVQAQAWLAGGYETEQVSISAEKLVFKRSAAPNPVERREGLAKVNQATFKPTDQTQGSEGVEFPEKIGSTTKKTGRHPAFGALKGMITLLPDIDYTEPADPDWAKVYED